MFVQQTAGKNNDNPLIVGIRQLIDMSQMAFHTIFWHTVCKIF